MTTPEPVESREQPRARVGAVCVPLGGCVGMHFLRQRDELAERDATIRELRAEVRRLESEKPPCDAGCRDYPEEECSRHGRKVREVWDALTHVQAARDAALAEVSRPATRCGTSGSATPRLI